MNLLWLLVGRGGSKSVPGKNLRRIGGRTLVEYKLGGAIAAGATDIVVSSDSAEIRGVAMHYGASREIVRPMELASDEATTASVVRHALETLGGEYDAVMLLEPSAPFTLPASYDTAIAMMQDADADLVVGMKYVEPHVAFVGERSDDTPHSVTGIIMQFQRMARRRQDFRPCWSMAGNLYLFRTEMFLRTGDIYGGQRNYGLLQDKFHGHEIDTPHDLELAEWYYEKGWV